MKPIQEDSIPAGSPTFYKRVSILPERFEATGTYNKVLGDFRVAGIELLPDENEMATTHVEALLRDYASQNRFTTFFLSISRGFASQELTHHADAAQENNAPLLIDPDAEFQKAVYFENGQLLQGHAQKLIGQSRDGVLVVVKGIHALDEKQDISRIINRLNYLRALQVILSERGDELAKLVGSNTAQMAQTLSTISALGQNIQKLSDALKKNEKTPDKIDRPAAQNLMQGIEKTVAQLAAKRIPAFASIINLMQREIAELRQIPVLSAQKAAVLSAVRAQPLPAPLASRKGAAIAPDVKAKADPAIIRQAPPARQTQEAPRTQPHARTAQAPAAKTERITTAGVTALKAVIGRSEIRVPDATVKALPIARAEGGKPAPVDQRAARTVTPAQKNQNIRVVKATVTAETNVRAAPARVINQTQPLRQNQEAPRTQPQARVAQAPIVKTEKVATVKAEAKTHAKPQVAASITALKAAITQSDIHAPEVTAKAPPATRAETGKPALAKQLAARMVVPAREEKVLQPIKAPTAEVRARNESTPAAARHVPARQNQEPVKAPQAQATLASAAKAETVRTAIAEKTVTEKIAPREVQARQTAAVQTVAAVKTVNEVRQKPAVAKTAGEKQVRATITQAQAQAEKAMPAARLATVAETALNRERAAPITSQEAKSAATASEKTSTLRKTVASENNVSVQPAQAQPTAENKASALAAPRAVLETIVANVAKGTGNLINTQQTKKAEAGPLPAVTHVVILAARVSPAQETAKPVLEAQTKQAPQQASRSIETSRTEPAKTGLRQSAQPAAAVATVIDRPVDPAVTNQRSTETTANVEKRTEPAVRQPLNTHTNAKAPVEAPAQAPAATQQTVRAAPQAVRTAVERDNVIPFVAPVRTADVNERKVEAPTARLAPIQQSQAVPKVVSFDPSRASEAKQEIHADARKAPPPAIISVAANVAPVIDPIRLTEKTGAPAPRQTEALETKVPRFESAAGTGKDYTAAPPLAPPPALPVTPAMQISTPAAETIKVSENNIHRTIESTHKSAQQSEPQVRPAESVRAGATADAPVVAEAALQKISEHRTTEPRAVEPKVVEQKFAEPKSDTPAITAIPLPRTEQINRQIGSGPAVVPSAEPLPAPPPALATALPPAQSPITTQNSAETAPATNPPPPAATAPVQAEVERQPTNHSPANNPPEKKLSATTPNEAPLQAKQEQPTQRVIIAERLEEPRTVVSVAREAKSWMEKQGDNIAKLFKANENSVCASCTSKNCASCGVSTASPTGTKTSSFFVVNMGATAINKVKSAFGINAGRCAGCSGGNCGSCMRTATVSTSAIQSNVSAFLKTNPAAKPSPR
jgi:hypothetical protein